VVRGGGLREKAGRAVWGVVVDCVKKRVGQCGGRQGNRLVGVWNPVLFALYWVCVCVAPLIVL
jgi:hypothetical protein